MDERGVFTESLKDLALICKANISVLIFFSRCVTCAIISDIAADLEHLFTAHCILQNSIFNEKYCLWKITYSMMKMTIQHTLKT